MQKAKKTENASKSFADKMQKAKKAENASKSFADRKQRREKRKMLPTFLWAGSKKQKTSKKSKNGKGTLHEKITFFWERSGSGNSHMVVYYSGGCHR